MIKSKSTSTKQTINHSYKSGTLYHLLNNNNQGYRFYGSLADAKKAAPIGMDLIHEIQITDTTGNGYLLDTPHSWKRTNGTWNQVK